MLGSWRKVCPKPETALVPVDLAAATALVLAPGRANVGAALVRAPSRKVGAALVRAGRNGVLAGFVAAWTPGAATHSKAANGRANRSEAARDQPQAGAMD